MKISELTENDVIHIRNKKEAKGIAELLSGLKSFTTKDIEFAISSSVSQYGNNACINTNRGEHLTYGSKPFYKQERYKVIPASKFLKQSISKKDLQEALSKVGEELSSMNERLGKLEVKSKLKTANGIEIDFDEVTEGLPKNWVLKLKQEYCDSAKKRLGWKQLVFTDGWLHSDKVIRGSAFHGYTEITFEQFKKWVLPKQPETKEIDWSKAGQLVKSNEVLVVTNGRHIGERFSGIRIMDYQHQSDFWDKNKFALCTEPVTLKNE